MFITVDRLHLQKYIFMELVFVLALSCGFVGSIPPIALAARKTPLNATAKRLSVLDFNTFYPNSPLNPNDYDKEVRLEVISQNLSK